MGFDVLLNLVTRARRNRVVQRPLKSASTFRPVSSEVGVAAQSTAAWKAWSSRSNDRT